MIYNIIKNRSPLFAVSINGNRIPFFHLYFTS